MTKRFLICGDSWGVGAYRYIGNPPVSIEPIANTGLDYYLTQSGHVVTNIAKGNASNFLQLKELATVLETDNNYYYVIWFQTEPNRDIINTVLGNKLESAIQYPQFDITDFSKCMSYIKDRNYYYAQCVYDKFKVPFIVVGGLSSIDPTIKNYSFPAAVIPNWLDDITDSQYDLAENMHQDNMLTVLTNFTNVDKVYMVEELDKMKVIEDALETHPNFSNGVHPNAQQFEILTSRLLGELGLPYQASLYTSA